MEHYYWGTSSKTVFITQLFIVTLALPRVGLYRLWLASRQAHRSQLTGE